MDLLYAKGLSKIFLLLALNAVEKYQIKTDYSHLDSSSVSLQGEYERKEKMSIEGDKNLEKEVPINITYGNTSWLSQKEDKIRAIRKK
jgi:hypothetical protein